MRTRVQTLLPSVLALTLVTLLAVPAATLAQSGAPAISMYPETAGPGSTVEITGIDFPPARVVEVQLATPDGTMPLTTTTTSRGGEFRKVVSLPLGVTDGAWELRSTAADGSTASFAFVTDPAAVAAAAAAVAAAEAASAATRGNTSGDIALMLIIAVVLGGLAFGVMFVYRNLREEAPPGMGRGDDLIWGGGSSNGPEQSASDEPHWKDTQPASATQGER